MADIINMMSNYKYDENVIAEAKEKLACHIEPPKAMPAGDAADRSAGESSSKGGDQTDFIDENGKVLLTQMTAAGG